MKAIQTEKPHAVVMVGAPGCGKSTFANTFAKTFNAPLVDNSRLRTLAKNADMAQELFLGQIAEISKTGQLMLIDSSQDSAGYRSEIARHLANLGYKVLYVWVQTDPVVARERLLKRYQKLGSKTEVIERVDKMILSYQPPKNLRSTVVISGRHTYSTQAKLVLQKLIEPRMEKQSVSTETIHDPAAPESSTPSPTLNAAPRSRIQIR